MQSEFLKVVEEGYLRRYGQVSDSHPEWGNAEWVVRDIAIVATVLDFLSLPTLVRKLANAREFDERRSAVQDRKSI